MLMSQPRVVGNPAQGDEAQAQHTASLPAEPLHFLYLSVKALSCTEFSYMAILGDECPLPSSQDKYTFG